VKKVIAAIGIIVIVASVVIVSKYYSIDVFPTQIFKSSAVENTSNAAINENNTSSEEKETTPTIAENVTVPAIEENVTEPAIEEKATTHDAIEVAGLSTPSSIENAKEDKPSKTQATKTAIETKKTKAAIEVKATEASIKEKEKVEEVLTPNAVEPIKPVVVQETSEGALDSSQETSDSAIDTVQETSDAAIDTTEVTTKPGIIAGIIEDVKETFENIFGPKKEPEPEVDLVELAKTQKRIEYILRINKNLSEEYAAELVALFEEFANARDYIDVELLMGMVRLESTFNADAGEKYVGLMQISAYYGQQAGYTLEELKDPRTNLSYAFGMLDELNVKCEGNIQHILTAYNMGYYGFKKKLDSGEELAYSFYNNCKKYADQIIASYEE